MTDDPASPFVETRPENPDVSSKAAFDLAKSWISTCLDSHDKCSNISVPLPTRVLDLRTIEDDRVVKLCMSQGKMAPYVALSYCWGGPQPEVLTAATLETYTHGVPLTSCPQTVQDAILVCRKLGFQYLWIDALCIIQDSSEDIAREIQKMNFIYSNAILTISASSAKGVKDGFLKKRIRQEDSQWFLLPFSSGDSISTNTIFARQSTPYQASSEPLNTRAWALQEDVLSPRVLTYDSYRIRWQCKSTYDADGGKIDDLGLDYNQNQKLVPLSEVKEEEKSSLDALKAWVKIVETYSTRTATFPSDTLPAISALAEYFSHVLGGEYLAGLWGLYLPQCLMWYAHRSNDYDLSQFKKRNQYIAPSWSWASLNGPTHFGSHFGMRGNVEIHVKIEECSVRRASEAMQFGEVIAGHLTISGFLHPVICSARTQNNQPTLFRMVFGVEELEPVPMSRPTPKSSTEVPSNPNPETFTFYPDDSEDFLQKQVHLHALLLCSFDSYYRVRLMAGLVVSRVALRGKEGKQLWIRRGLFQGTDRNENFKGSKEASITIV